MPLGLPFFLMLWVLYGLFVALVEIGILQYAFEALGVSRRYMLLLLVCSLLGSYVNIPIAHLGPRPMHSGEVVEVFGMRYVVPMVVGWPQTVLAINVGGAVIPVLLSIYLIVRHGQYFNSLIAVGIVTVAVHALARPVPGVGVVVPIFIPPLITAAVALSLSRFYAAPLAYIAGSLGTLLGADVLNLGRIQGLGAPIASIGGAGKFDGIFLTGLVAMLLAGLLGGRRRRPRVEEPA